MGEDEVVVGGVPVYLVVPETVPAPGVLVLHETFGLNDDIRRVARRFASMGYVAAAPDLVGGGRPLCVARALLAAARGRGPVVDDAVGALIWLAGRPEVVDERVGVAGFCLGGSFALLLGARGRARAVSAAYGAYPGDDAAARLCPTVAHYGGRDRLYRGVAPRLEAALAEAGVPHDVVLYPDVGHSFMNRAEGHGLVKALGRPLLAVGYDPDAAEDAWRRIEAFFARHLHGEDRDG